MSFKIADEWAVGFDDNFVLVAVVDYCFLLIPWMKLRRYGSQRLH